jgi:hypothetical protein
MSFAKRYTLSITTAADGSATVYCGPVNGRILRVDYDGNLAATLDLTITGRTSGESILSLTDVAAAAASWAPRRATHSTAGAAALYAGGGSAVLDDIWLVDEDIKVIVAQGGNVDTGVLTFYVG